MKTYLMSMKRAEHGKVAIKADSFEEALRRIEDGDFDEWNVNMEWGYSDESWQYDPEWGADVIGESK